MCSSARWLLLAVRSTPGQALQPAAFSPVPLRFAQVLGASKSTYHYYHPEYRVRWAQQQTLGAQQQRGGGNERRLVSSALLPTLPAAQFHTLAAAPGCSTTYCADAFAGKSRDWLMAYPWVSAPAGLVAAKVFLTTLRPRLQAVLTRWLCPPCLAPTGTAISSTVFPYNNCVALPLPLLQVAYCAPYMGGMSQANCGKCLRMTNSRTASQVIVRIVDMCGHGGEPAGLIGWPCCTTHCRVSGVAG